METKKITVAIQISNSPNVYLKEVDSEVEFYSLLVGKFIDASPNNLPGITTILVCSHITAFRFL